MDDHSSNAISSPIAIVAPLLARSITNSATITKKPHAVFTDDNVMMVCFLSDSPLAVIASIVPVEELMPGINETSMPAKLPVITDIIDAFFALLSNLTFSIICEGIFGFVIMDVSSVGSPKSPARAGKRTGDDRPIGESTGQSNITKPKIPEMMNIINANNIPKTYGSFPCFILKSSILPFSVAISKIDIAISTQNIISLNVE